MEWKKEFDRAVLFEPEFRKFEIMPHLFMVKINKQAQKDFKEKLSKNSLFFMPAGLVFNSRNMEHGEIVQIGDDMKDIYGWEDCQVGQTLIFHHTIEDQNSTRGPTYFLFEDERYNYYAVDLINVRGFYDGKKITPHPEFIFLKNLPAYPNMDEADKATGNKIQKVGSLYMVTNWETSPQNVAQKSQKIKEHIESLAKMKRTPEIQKNLEAMEAERIDLNRQSQVHRYLPYRVAYSNRKVDRDFGRKVLEDDILFCFNRACLYVSNFQLKEYTYIICPVEHIGCLIN